MACQDLGDEGENLLTAKDGVAYWELDSACSQKAAHWGRNSDSSPTWYQLRGKEKPKPWC